MKICYKLFLSYLCISLLGCIGGYFGIKAIHDIQSGFDEVSNETIPVKNELHKLQASISKIVIYTNEVIFLEHKLDHQKIDQDASTQINSIASQRTSELLKKVNDWRSDRKQFEDSVKKYKDLVIHFFPDEIKYLQKISDSGQRILQISDQIINSEKKHRNNSEIILKQAELEQVSEQFNVVIEAALEHEDMELREKK